MMIFLIFISPPSTSCDLASLIVSFSVHILDLAGGRWLGGPSCGARRSLVRCSALQRLSDLPAACAGSAAPAPCRGTRSAQHANSPGVYRSLGHGEGESPQQRPCSSIPGLTRRIWYVFGIPTVIFFRKNCRCRVSFPFPTCFFLSSFPTCIAFPRELRISVTFSPFPLQP